MKQLFRKGGLREFDWRRFTITGLAVLFGNALLAFGVAAFLLPFDILSDGTTGIGIALSNLFPDIDVARIILVLNLFLLLVGFLILGKQFFLTTIAGSLLYPLILEGLEKVPGIGTMTDDPTLAAICAGVIIGIGMGLTLRVGSSTGGMDIVALIANRLFRLPVSGMIYVLGVLVIGIQAIFVPAEKVLLGILLLVLESFFIEQTAMFGKSRLQIFAVSEKYGEIREVLLSGHFGGVTVLETENENNKKQQAVLCVLHPRKLHDACAQIKRIDPKVFLSVSKINEVYHGNHHAQALADTLGKNNKDEEN